MAQFFWAVDRRVNGADGVRRTSGQRGTLPWRRTASPSACQLLRQPLLKVGERRHESLTSRFTPGGLQQSLRRLSKEPGQPLSTCGRRYLWMASARATLVPV